MNIEAKTETVRELLKKKLKSEEYKNSREKR